MSQQIKHFRNLCEVESLSQFEDRVNEYLLKHKGWQFKAAFHENKDSCHYCVKEHTVFIFTKDVADHEEELKHDMD